MNDQIDEIKSKIDIVSLISEYIQLRKAGRNYKALCPFHQEKTPSFIVSPELQIFKCFGCNAGGDAISFLEQYEGMDFYEALKFLAQRVGVNLRPSSFGQGIEKERLYQINQYISYFYNFVLLNHPKGKRALDYLIGDRGLKLATIKTFQLGFSPDQALALKSFLLDKKKVTLAELESVGVVYRRGGEAFDRFRGRITFPLHDHRGNIVGFSGRVLPQVDKSSLAQNQVSKYINTPETDIYHKSNLLYALNLTKGDIKKSGVAIVVEGELDVISCWQLGITNVVAIKGSALTDEQVRLLSRFTKKIILALDADFAGDEAARRGIEIAERGGLEVKVANLAPFKDPDEAARVDPRKLEKSIKEAAGVWDFVIDSIFLRQRQSKSFSQVTTEVIPILASIGNLIIQAHYANLVAKKLSVPEGAVFEELEKFKQRSHAKVEVEVRPKVLTRGRRELIEERLLSCAFRWDPKTLLDQELRGLITTPLASRIVEEFVNFSQSHKEFDPSLFAGNLPKELVEGFTDMILRDIKGLESEDPEKLKRELDLVKRELKILDIREHLQKLSVVIRKMEGGSGKEALLKKQKEFRELTKKLAQLEGVNFKGIIL